MVIATKADTRRRPELPAQSDVRGEREMKAEAARRIADVAPTIRSGFTSPMAQGSVDEKRGRE